MGFKCGIVGLPNVGKSTLFNALSESAQAQAENFPFCTIEPNVGIVPVPDERLDKLAALAGSAKIIPTQLTFVDIAGLVRGASQGEGLGNKFLAHIREVDAIIHVVRCFEDSDVTHVGGQIDPVADAEIVETELMLADLESLERRQAGLEKKARGGDKEAKADLALVQRAEAFLRDGKPARLLEIENDQRRRFRTLQLLSAKPVLYVCNVEEDAAASGNRYSEQVERLAQSQQAGCITVSAAIEAEVAELGNAGERREFLSEMGLDESGLNKVIRAGYDLLDLITFFTAGPKEARAWTVKRGTAAQKAAGAIHTDFEKGFIRAETIAYQDYIACGGEQGAKDAGKMRQEGKDYIVQDGDVLLIRFNV